MFNLHVRRFIFCKIFYKIIFQLLILLFYLKNQISIQLNELSINFDLVCTTLNNTSLDTLNEHVNYIKLNKKGPINSHELLNKRTKRLTFSLNDKKVEFKMDELKFRQNTFFGPLSLSRDPLWSLKF